MPTNAAAVSERRSDQSNQKFVLLGYIKYAFG